MTSEAPPRHLRARAAVLSLAAPIGALLMGGVVTFAVMLPYRADWVAPLLAPLGVFAGYAAMGRRRDGIKQVVRCYFYVFGALVALLLLFRPDSDRDTALVALVGYLGGLAIGMAQSAWDVYHTGRPPKAGGVLDGIVP